MSKRNIALFIGAIVLFIIALFSIGGSFLTPYVSIAAAKKQPGTSVQVIGIFNESLSLAKDDSGVFFSIVDKTGSGMRVHYKGILPRNYSHAEQVVVLGSYDKNAELFTAEKILVKCPSKYKRKTQ